MVKEKKREYNPTFLKKRSSQLHNWYTNVRLRGEEDRGKRRRKEESKPPMYKIVE